MQRTLSAAVGLLLTLALVLGSGSVPVQAAAAQTLTVDATTPISRIVHPFWGVNYVGFWDDIQGSAGSRQALKNAGIQLIRFPGGEPANWMDFTKPDRAPYWTTTSISELQAYAQGAGARLILQTNPTRNEISDTGERNDPSGAHAAAVVRYVRQVGADVPYWEIGNEPDLHLTNAMDRAAMQWYFDAFNEQAAAMKAEQPGIKIMGPAGTNAWQWWGLGSLEMFLAEAGNRQGSGLADGVSLHYYNYTSGQCAGWDQVRAFGQSWQPSMDYIKQQIAAYDTRPLPVFISETNAAVGALYCEINQTMASALANADLFGAYRASGVQAVQFFGSVHGGNGWGILYGSGEARPADSATPTYFILPIWTRSGNEVLRVTGASDPANTLSSYASRR
jgi:Glycosyl hydrolases family 39